MSDPAVPRDLRDLPTLPPSPSQDSPAEAPTLPPKLGPAITPEDIHVRYFGNYALSEEISRGGMGVVYRARQINLNRTVALKMILAGQLASKADVQRFQKEAEAAANFDHPNIVPIYEVGEHEGHHYFSMKLIEGGSLAQQLARFRQDPRAAAKLLAAVARAVHHAHERGILHRDIKPGNILVDQRGQPHVTDFGVAKRVEGNTALTQIGVVVGTPSYMSPEQARSEKGLTTAVDIYSLGAVLYELLTGRPPFRSTSHFDTLLQVLEQQPEPPRLLNPRADRDLEAICLKCLEKEPQKRYRSAEALAEDLERWLAHEPIQARPLHRGARLWRWCLRNPAVAGLLVGAALTLVAGTAFSTYFAIQANERAREATQEKHRADQNAQTALQERDRADENAKTALRERDRAQEKASEALANAKRAEESAADARMNLYAAHMSVAQNAWEKGQLAQVPYLLNLYRNAKLGEPELRGWEWYYQDHLCRSDLLTLRVPRAPVHVVTFSPDGARLASAGVDGKIHFWRLGTGQEIRVLPGHTAEVYGLAFSPDGAQLASAGGDQTIRLWDCTSGRQMHTFKGHQGPVRCVTFSSDGKHLASSGADQTVKIWDISTDRALHTLLGHKGRVLSVAYSPDGARLASAGADGIVKLWRSADAVELRSLTGHSGEVASVVFSPDGGRLASAGSDATVRLWDSVSGKLLRSLTGHKSTVWGLAFSSDGTRLASGSQDMTVKMWDAATGQELRTFRGHIREVYSVAFSPDGTRLASGSLDMTAKVWDAVAAPEPRALQGVWCMAFHRDGNQLALTGPSLTVRLWNRVSGQELHTLKGHTRRIWGLAFSRDGIRLASASGDQTVKLWDAANGRDLHTFKGHEAPVWSVAFSPDGTQLASASGDRTVKIWDTASGQEIRTLRGHTARVICVVFSPGGARLASASDDGAVKVWDAASGHELHTLLGHGGPLMSVAYSPDGTQLASASSDWSVKLWDAASGQEIRTLRGHTNVVREVTFSPDGRRLATASSDQTVRLWDIASGQELLTLPSHRGMVLHVAFSPDGQWLASAGAGGTLKLWDARPWSPEVLAEREAEAIVEYLFNKPLPKTEVIKGIQENEAVSARVRKRALVLVELFRPEQDPRRFDAASRSLVRQHGLAPRWYRQALVQAQTACRLGPDRPLFLSTLGIAQYRLEMYREAVETLTRSEKAATARNLRTLAADQAFLAMAHVRLGELQKAQAYGKRLQDTKTKPPWNTDEEAQAFQHEAELLLQESTEKSPQGS